jgi:hypothetical protein
MDITKLSFILFILSCSLFSCRAQYSCPGVVSLTFSASQVEQYGVTYVPPSHLFPPFMKETKFILLFYSGTCFLIFNFLIFNFFWNFFFFRFTFDKSYTVGMFANGDYWVLGPITVICYLGERGGEKQQRRKEKAGRKVNNNLHKIDKKHNPSL